MRSLGLLSSLLAGLLLLAAFLPPASRPAEAQDDLAAAIDAYVQERMAAWDVPGLALVAIDGGRVVRRRGYGLADREAGTPMTDATLVPIGSTGKALTALAVLQLVEQGRLALDAPVTDYLPYFRVADACGARITPRELLSHTAGLPASGIADEAWDADALERYVRGLASVPLRRAPGSGWEYANSGFAVAGLVVQTVAGEPYEQYLAEHVFEPLGMQRATFDPAVARARGLAQGYYHRGETLVPFPPPLSRSDAPAGGLMASAADVASYLLALLHGGERGGVSVISPASLATMWAPQVSLDETLAYGLGWYVGDLDGALAVWHSGSMLTTGSRFDVAPDEQRAVAVLTNTDDEAKEEIADGVLALLRGTAPERRAVPPPRPPNTYQPDPADWAAYAGEYILPFGTLRVYRDGTRLRGHLPNVELDLAALDAHTFVVHARPPLLEGAVVAFRPDAAGRMALWQGDQLLGAPPVAPPPKADGGAVCAPA
ncbi:MAG TPA: serine hydrolase domain-containing protein [Chloroflexota bacterium]|nr:serine hydrolase domain-containing protein [Chloroflexota bacterium]